jgi:hypothetical protein
MGGLPYVVMVCGNTFERRCAAALPPLCRFAAALPLCHSFATALPQLLLLHLTWRLIGGDGNNYTVSASSRMTPRQEETVLSGRSRILCSRSLCSLFPLSLSVSLPPSLPPSHSCLSLCFSLSVTPSLGLSLSLFVRRKG